MAEEKKQQPNKEIQTDRNKKSVKKEDLIKNTQKKIEKKEIKILSEVKEESSAKESKETQTDRNKKPIKDADIFDIESWKPKTELGRKVKLKEIKDIDEILNNGIKILEQEIVDVLLPTLEKDLLLIGQSKGKFGGGQRRVFKQTQKKSPEGNKPQFATYAVTGNKNGYVGVGYGKAKETVPAREKAFRKAKLNLIKIKRGCGSWQCNCKSGHSIPFKVSGKCGSVIVTLIPAPKGTGLTIEKSCATILEMAGIKDIWSTTKGQTKSKLNLIKACMKALNKLNSTKLNLKDYENLGIQEKINK